MSSVLSHLEIQLTFEPDHFGIFVVLAEKVTSTPDIRIHGLHRLGLECLERVHHITTR